jgi:simple sugar transport system permease protein
MAAGLLIALVHGNLSHRLAANTFVVGLALNALVIGITSYFYQQYPNANSGQALPYWAVPGLSKIPVIGPSVFNQQWPVYVLFALVPAVWWLVQRTKWGLEVRASGENPESADATGIRVNFRRRQSLYLCGALSGAGGAYLAIGITGSFTPDMTVGIGYLAISAVIFGGWTMTGTVLGCVVIGGIYSLGLSLPAIGARINGELQLALPYLAALGAMVFFAKSQRAPRALARPFTRGVA